MARVITNLKVLTLTRTQTLYRVVREIVEGVTGKPVPKTVKKGILDEALLSAVIIYILTADNKKIATVELHIDWEKHHLYSQAKGMKRLRFDPEKPVSEQVSEAISEITKFISGLRVEGVTTEVWYRTRRGGPVPYEEARKKLGFSGRKSKQPEWASGKFLRGRFSPGELDELMVEFRSKVE